MMRWLLIITSYIYCQVAIANDDYLAIANEAVANKDRLIAVYRADAEKAKNHAAEIVKQYTAANQSARETAKIIIFVSFSMPDQSLQAYLRDAKRVHASVVIRGLYQNSFKKTVERVSQLVKASEGSGIELNPVLFKKLAVSTVPTIVVLPSANNCLLQSSCNSSGDYDSLSGNITLESALKLLRDRGDVSQKVAGEELTVLQGGQHV